MGNIMFRECCSSNNNLEHINSFSDDSYDYIDHFIDTRDNIYNMNVDELKTSSGPPIFI